MTKLVSPHQNPVIRKYLKDVLAWHGYIRFLGMPTLQTNPDMPIDELYVAQSLSFENLPTDKEPKSDQLHSPVKILLEKHHLVVLGDPGSGKSTLINWFAWQLAAGFVDRLPRELADLIPIPIVLRELKLDKVTTFETLIDAFLERPVAKNLKMNRDVLIKYFEAGKVLLLVDGFDEISLELRERLLVTFGLFFLNYNTSFSIFTSRKVGYEQAPIGFSKVVSKDENSLKVGSTKKTNFLDIAVNTVMNITAKLLPLNPVEVFVAPFTDKQIDQFSLNWYRENTTGNEDGAKFLHDEFVSSIRSNESTLQLARTPHLLTMMALIFKVRLQLPNGRALLYDLIAQAYLESIDTARKLKDPFLWQEKKRWLAKVAFEMQMQRLYSEEKGSRSSRELLVSREQVLSWIKDAIQISYSESSVNIDNYASEYLDWIARRSGLLLPRGDNQFSFLHLSFQEYFSAVYIQQQLENPEYIEPDIDIETLDSRFSTKPLKIWASERSWQQVFVFLFELMAEKPGWIMKLFRECFSQNIYRDCLSILEKSPKKEFESYVTPELDLMLCLLENPHVYLSNKKIEKIVYETVDLGWSQQKIISDFFNVDGAGIISETIISRLLNIDRWRSIVISCLGSVAGLSGIHLSNMSSEALELFLSELSERFIIKNISLTNCAIENIKCLLEFEVLESLCLFQSAVSSIEGISALKKIRALDLFGNPISDISEVAYLKELKHVDLRSTEVENFEPLIKCNNLKRIGCSGISDVEFFSRFKNLEEFVVFDAPLLKNIAPLLKLKKLSYLSLLGTGVNKEVVDKLPKNIHCQFI